MIQIESIRIENFRGIKSLVQSLNRKNLGICGPNGTGKSGIVDAIEFALTGSVTRLSGAGSGGVSVRQHAAHVDHRDQPQKSTVALTVTAVTSGKTFTIERSVANPRKPNITPAPDSEVNALVKGLSEHPEFALSRREILKYVIVEPGVRSKEVQALLKLDDVEKVRASFTTIVNGTLNQIRNAETAVGTARTQLMAAMKIEELRPPMILEAANERRAVLGLGALTELTKDTSLKGGVGAGSGMSKKPQVIRAVAVAELGKLEDIAAAASDLATKSAAEVVLRLERLSGNAELLRAFKQRAFLVTGLALIDHEICPFCETEWDLAELRRRVGERLAQAKEVETIQSDVTTASQPLLMEISKIEAIITEVVRSARGATEGIEVSALTEWSDALANLAGRLKKTDDVEELVAVLANDWRRMPTKLKETLGTVRRSLEALPEVSKEEESKEFLIVAQERLETFQKNRRQLELAKKQGALAAKVAAVYGSTSNTFLTNIYHEVENDFSRLYAIINSEDESDFTAKLTPSLGKLGFEVEFYGRGYFPPGAYHSEGHQDGMGLCLYLALMRRTMGSDFTFAVLDDVLMSVDAVHRKEVCRLIKTEFPNTQFVFTTHDDAWLQHMKNEGLVSSKSVLQFRKWSVDDGPHVWQFEDVWAEIAHDLEHNDIPGAAAALRRYLEFLGGDLSQRLRSQVEYRSSGVGYELAELWSAVAGRWVDLLGKAKATAQSWQQEEEFEKLKTRHEAFSAKLAKSKVDQWELNAAVHYNEWAALQKGDFLPVVASFKELIDCFKCSVCGAYLYVAPSRGTVEAIRCDCNKTNINLKKKVK